MTDAGSTSVDLVLDGYLQRTAFHALRLAASLRCAKGHGKIPGSSGAAENAAPGTQGTVPVGAGHAAIQGNLIDLGSKAVFQFIIQRVPGFVVPVHMFSVCVCYGSPDTSRQ